MGGHLASAEVTAAFKALRAVAEAIRELGEVPEGQLYAGLSGHLELSVFEKIVGILVSADLVSRTHHRLRWIGPEAEAQA